MQAEHMATKSENADIAVLQSQMITVIEGVSDINKKLDSQMSLFVTHGEFNEFKKRWALSHSIVAIMTAVGTALIVYFLTGKHIGG